MDNCYLMIFICLLGFFAAMILYLKFVYQKFTPVSSGIPAVTAPTTYNPQIQGTTTPPLQKDVHYLDTRYDYQYQPPVNPMVEQSVIYTSLPANEDLYTQGNYESKYPLLEQPPNGPTNQLNYSGGETQMISIPLQKNYPYGDNVRSNDILITPYNKIKFGTC
jgi:hypothetical protein